MAKARKWWKVALAAIALLVAAQIAVSLAVRTDRLHNYLSAHLEKAFGRPVQVKHFNVEILPSPRIYATGVTVGDDPAFGYEYFLRAEHLTAGLRWSGFLRGHFEFGTLFLGQPSLTLVKNSQGRWNLEDWLPPAKSNTVENSRVYGPSRAPAIANRLEKIEFDDGRINFKNADSKQPFALTGVTGNVEQIAAGRWKLQLEAQPWRSGVALQSTGTLKVQGDIAGTSSRLQPASFTVRWDRVSLADMFRLLDGQDHGVRGTFALEATAKSGAPPDGVLSGDTQGDVSDSVPGDWAFSLKARATQIHRWDLTERADNPKLTATLQGRWNVALRKISADQLLVETAVSNLRGSAQFGGAVVPLMQIKVNSAGVQAADILAWYRAFQPGVAEGIAADEFFTGTLALQGWPLQIQALNFSTLGGVVTIPDVDESLKVFPFRAGLDHMNLALDPVHLSLMPPAPAPLTAGRTGRVNKRRAERESAGEINLTVTQDFIAHKGALNVQGRADKTEDLLKIASAFGHRLNHGWDLSGPIHADLRREWPRSSKGVVWIGAIDVNNAQLAAAGLNQPVQLHQARLEWRDGRRIAQISLAEGFGASWSGSVAEGLTIDPLQEGIWNVQLHADRLDATELDRWVGPRARPGWLQRLLPSLLGGGADQSALASELVRRLNIIGDLQVDEFNIEKLKLEQLRVHGALRNLQLDISNGQAQWAGGTVHATMNAEFIPRPVYDVKAELNGVDLTKLPVASSALDRLGGLASGTLHLKTTGVGREELLQKLSGNGAMRLANLEFHGWDVSGGVADGDSHSGSSRWTSGAGAFTVRNRSVVLQDVRLDGNAETTLINGTVSFARDADLAVETGAGVNSGKRSIRNATAPARVLKIVGPLDDPRISEVKSAPRQPAD